MDCDTRCCCACEEVDVEVCDSEPKYCDGCCVDGDGSGADDRSCVGCDDIIAGDSADDDTRASELELWNAEEDIDVGV